MKANVYTEDMSQKTKAPAKAGSAKWLVVLLLLLSFVPIAAGAFRLTELTSGAEITPANARFFASPLPVVLHILSASLYALLGAFQFAPSFRRYRPGWHRAAGWLLVLCGLLVGLSGLWMTLFYPRPDGTGMLLYALRLLFGSAMVMSIILGFATIRRGDVIRHRAWMMRGYAIGLGAGTQVLTLMAGELIIGPPSELSEALLMGAGWVINLVVAEGAIRKRLAPPAHTASAVVSHSAMSSAGSKQPIQHRRALFLGGNALEVRTVSVLYQQVRHELGLNGCRRRHHGHPDGNGYAGRQWGVPVLKSLQLETYWKEMPELKGKNVDAFMKYIEFNVPRVTDLYLNAAGQAETALFGNIFAAYMKGEKSLEDILKELDEKVNALQVQ